jgi:hypothetical protein
MFLFFISNDCHQLSILLSAVARISCVGPFSLYLIAIASQSTRCHTERIYIPRYFFVLQVRVDAKLHKHIEKMKKKMKKSPSSKEK